LSGDNEMMLYN